MPVPEALATISAAVKTAKVAGSEIKKLIKDADELAVSDAKILYYIY
jgi:hypothetical protein